MAMVPQSVLPVAPNQLGHGYFPDRIDATAKICDLRVISECVDHRTQPLGADDDVIVGERDQRRRRLLHPCIHRA